MQWCCSSTFFSWERLFAFEKNKHLLCRAGRTGSRYEKTNVFRSTRNNEMHTTTAATFQHFKPNTASSTAAAADFASPSCTVRRRSRAVGDTDTAIRPAESTTRVQSEVPFEDTIDRVCTVLRSSATGQVFTLPPTTIKSMGKKSRSGSTNDCTPDAQSAARNDDSGANNSAALPKEKSTPAEEGPGWVRFKVRALQLSTPLVTAYKVLLYPTRTKPV